MLENVLSRFKILPKIIGLGAIVALCITVTLVYITVQFRASKWEAKKDQTRNLVLAAHSTLEHYAELARDGVMSNEEAQKAAMEAVKIMRYEGDNYFWINDLEPKMIMHPNYPADKKPEWYETNGLVDYADPAGKKLFVEFVKVIKEKGEGFVDYQWTKPGQEELVPKVSYVKLLPEWGWIVGSGVYVDDVEAEMASLTRKILIIGLAVAGLAIVLSLVLARSISRPMSNMAAAALGFSEGNIYQKLNYEGKDEIGQLADAFRQMIIYLQQMAKAADRLAQGDLTVEVTPRSDQDALGQAFHQMITNLRHLVGQVTDNATNVATASNQLAAVADQASLATAQITATTQQVASGTTQQAKAATTTAASIEQMTRAIDGIAQGAQEQAAAVNRSSNITTQISSAIQQVTTNAQVSAQSATDAAQVAREGAIAVEANLKGMESIKAKVGLSAQKVQEMGQHSHQIGAIVETIDNIASQTNLLALNAAIEAARAGEHGKGFAVVADEVRKLAEKSTQATKEIATLINGIQLTVAEAMQAMHEGAEEVEIGVTRSNESGAALNSILQAVETVNQQVEGIATAAQQMNASSDELVSAMVSVSTVVEENSAVTEEMAAGSNEFSQAIGNIANVSYQNSAAVEEMNAATKKVSDQVEEVTGTAQALNEMAVQLQAVVAQFKLDKAISPSSRLESISPSKIVAKDKKVSETSFGHQQKPVDSSTSTYVWNEATMASGDATIDKHHQDLIDLINRLITAMSKGQGYEYIKETLDSLDHYIDMHFSYEETCMEKYRCPIAKLNKNAHEKFVSRFRELSEEFYRHGPSTELLFNLKKDLGDWFVNHISRTDTQLRPCVKKPQIAAKVS
ncbi:MAG TPA: bacteriohemerythrin [Anaerolineae bacterium]|nr:bacteriohemerythrin [Anaerolineae bacterium]